MIKVEIRNWRYLISWDNPLPADSSGIRNELESLGRLINIQTKTTVALVPNAHTKWRDVRRIIKRYLDPKKGNAVYVNMKTGKAFQIGTRTDHKWKLIL